MIVVAIINNDVCFRYMLKPLANDSNRTGGGIFWEHRVPVGSLEMLLLMMTKKQLLLPGKGQGQEKNFRAICGHTPGPVSKVTHEHCGPGSSDV